MVHDPQSSQLPEDWREQVGRAYLTFGVDSLLEAEDTELGLRSFLRGAQEYWTTARRSAKAKKQLRDPESKEWIEQRAGIPSRQARADIGIVDELDIPDEDLKRSPRKFRLPQLNPGLRKQSEAIKDEHGPVRDVRGRAFRRERIKSVIPQHVLDRIHARRTEEGLEPFMEPDGPWEKNGADLRNLSEDVVAQMLERLAIAKKADPRAAGSIEEMTANIIDAFKAAAPDEAAFGEEWYATAAQEVLDLAEEFGVDPHVVAALVASTSPRTEWEMNLAAAYVALSSLMPDRSPAITDEFLNTRMTYDLDLEGNPLKPGQKPPTGLEYILATEGIRDSFKAKHPKHADKVDEINPATGRKRSRWVETETDEEYEQRISDMILDTLYGKNPDGSPVQIYQIRNQKLRSALMDINNRVLAEEQAKLLPAHMRRPGMGLLVPKISSDGHTQYERLRGFSRILATNYAGIDRLFGYEELSPLIQHLPQGWSGLPTNDVDMYHRINETLGGHKTRSFYNNIITHGKSDFATIDVHALRAALMGKAATQAKVSVPGAEKLLENEKFKKPDPLPDDATPEEKAERAAELARQDAIRAQAKDDMRNGVYAVVNEAFRQATEQINAERAEEGLPPLSPAQVQAVAWIASRPESIGADFMNMALQERDPSRAAARVLPQVPAGQRELVMQVIGGSRSLGDARRNLVIAGIDPDNVLPLDEVGADRFVRANAARKSLLDEFQTLKQFDTMNLGAGHLATAAWLTNKFDSDEEVAERLRNIYADKKGNKPNFKPADAALIREMLTDKYTRGELLGDAGKEGIQSRLDAYNEERRQNGIYSPLTYDQFLEFLRNSDYQ